VRKLFLLVSCGLVPGDRITVALRSAVKGCLRGVVCPFLGHPREVRRF